MNEQKNETGSPETPVNPTATTADPKVAEAMKDAKAENGAVNGFSLEQQLAEAKAENTRLVDGWQRTAAEFANYRKRVDRERADTYDLAAVETLKKLLPVIDDFDRAIQNVPADQTSGLAYDSLKLLHRKLINLLETIGVKTINPVGETFNPAYHEALGQDEGTGAPSGQVTVVLQKGYVHGDRVLRAAMVRVSS